MPLRATFYAGGVGPYFLIGVPVLLLSLVAALTVRVWRRPAPPRPGRRAAAALLAFVVLDAGLVRALPALGKSYGPLLSAGAYLFCIRVGLYLLLLLAGLLEALRRLRPAQALRGSPAGLVLFWGLNLLLVAMVVDAFYVEPFALRVTERTIAAPGLSRPLRIVHLSDLHVERTTSREHNRLALVRTVEPDLILLTGDYLSLAYVNDPRARHDGREFLSQPHAPLGVYAVASSEDGPDTMHLLFEGLPITVLDDEVARLPTGRGDLYLVGVRLGGRGRDEAALRRVMAEVPAGAYKVLLYHTPDLADAAAETGVDLYPSG